MLYEKNSCYNKGKIYDQKSFIGVNKLYKYVCSGNCKQKGEAFRVVMMTHKFSHHQHHSVRETLRPRTME